MLNQPSLLASMVSSWDQFFFTNQGSQAPIPMSNPSRTTQTGQPNLREDLHMTGLWMLSSYANTIFRATTSILPMKRRSFNCRISTLRASTRDSSATRKPRPTAWERSLLSGRRITCSCGRLGVPSHPCQQAHSLQPLISVTTETTASTAQRIGS